jgi:hypothetical protein
MSSGRFVAPTTMAVRSSAVRRTNNSLVIFRSSVWPRRRRHRDRRRHRAGAARETLVTDGDFPEDPGDADYAIDELLNSGWLYEVGDELRVTTSEEWPRRRLFESSRAALTDQYPREFETLADRCLNDNSLRHGGDDSSDQRKSVATVRGKRAVSRERSWKCSDEAEETEPPPHPVCDMKFRTRTKRGDRKRGANPVESTGIAGEPPQHG